jgi:hypothetical protein
MSVFRQYRHFGNTDPCSGWRICHEEVFSVEQIVSVLKQADGACPSNINGVTFFTFAPVMISVEMSPEETEYPLIPHQLDFDH